MNVSQAQHGADWTLESTGYLVENLRVGSRGIERDGVGDLRQLAFPSLPMV